MRISINVTNFSWPDGAANLPTRLAETVGAADAAGVHAVWVSDHVLQIDPTCSIQGEMLEAYTTLGYLAARSERVHLGTMVSAVTFRPPAVLIKAVTTLDVLCGSNDQNLWMVVR